LGAARQLLLQHCTEKFIRRAATFNLLKGFEGK
jgi:hypothetical protein